MFEGISTDNGTPNIKWVQDSSHPKHPLKEIFKNTKFRCNICKIKGNGIRLRCDKCDVNIHDGCSSLPATLPENSVHRRRRHLLCLKTSKPCCLSSPPRCRLCRGKIRGSYYKCGKCCCGFSLHPLCSRVSETVAGNPLHPTHPLTLMKTKKAKKCDVCEKKCRRWRYCCKACNVDIHIECLEKGIDVVNAKQERTRSVIDLIGAVIGCFASLNTN